MSSSMCRATLLPEPDSPLTMMSRIDTRAPSSSAGQAGLDHVLGVMVGGLFFVFLDASIQLVGQGIDGGIHVVFSRIAVDLVSPQHEGGLGLVAEFFDREHAMNVDGLLEVLRKAFDFLDYVGAQCVGDFHMMTAEIELHSFPPKGLTKTRGQP